MLAGLAGAMVPTLWIVVAAPRRRSGRGAASSALLFAGDGRAVMATLEIVLFARPGRDARVAGAAARPRQPRPRGDGDDASPAALYRFDTFLVAFMPGRELVATSRACPRWLVTIGLVAFEVLAYVVIVKTFPILSGARRRREKAGRLMSTHITVDPITRIEGHLRIDVEVDDGVVTKAWSSGQMFRGIERILQGRDPREAWLFTQRFCGVCTTVHAIASVRAVENALKLEIPLERAVHPQPDRRSRTRCTTTSSTSTSCRRSTGSTSSRR